MPKTFTYLITVWVFQEGHKNLPVDLTFNMRCVNGNFNYMHQQKEINQANMLFSK